MKRPRGRIRRVLSIAGKGFVFLLVGILCLVAVLLAALDSKPVRALVASRVSALLKKELGGTVIIEHIGRLGVRGAADIRVRAFTPEGPQSLFADGVAARVDTVELIRSLVSSGPIVVRLVEARAAYVDASLEMDADGTLSIVRTFAPKTPELPVRARAGTGRGVRITIGDAVLSRGWVHGRPGGMLVDADVLGANAIVDLKPDQLRIYVARAEIGSRGMPAGADVAGIATLEASRVVPDPMAVHGTFDGTVGGIDTNVNARLRNGMLHASLRAERGPEQVSTLPGASGLPYDLRLTAEASGPTSNLRVRAHAETGPSSLDAAGNVSLSPGVAVNGVVVVRHADVRRFAPSVPRTDLDLRAKGSLDLASGVPRGKFVVDTDPTIVSGVLVPRVSAVASLQGPVLEATAIAADARGRAHVTAELRPSAKGAELDVNATVHVDDLAKATRSKLAGRGDVFAKGVIDMSAERLRASVVVDAEDLAVAGAHVDRAFVSSALAGELGNPAVEAAFAAENVALGERRFKSVAGLVTGSRARSSVEAALEGESRVPSMTARGDVALDAGVAFRDVTVTAERDGTTALLGVSAVRVGAGELHVDRAVALGLGDPIFASVAVTPRTTELGANASRVDIRRTARVLGLDAKRFSGELGADVHLLAGARSAQGHVDVQLRNAVFARETCGAGEVRAEFDGRRVDVLVEGDWNGGRVDLRSDAFEIDGPVLAPESWEHARGAVDLATDVDLAHVRMLVPEHALPFEELGGRARVHFRFEREDRTVPPTVALSVRTSGLELSRKGPELEPADATAVQAPAPWRLRGIDLDADLRLNPKTDRTDFDATVRDRRGPIAQVTFDSASLPVAFLQHPEQIRPFFERIPAHVVVTVPRRRLSDFPPPLARPSLRGSIAFHAEATGTLVAPKVDASITVDGVSSRSSRRVPPFGARVDAHYDGDRATIDASVDHAGQLVAKADARGHVNVADLLDRRPRRFDVAARVGMDGFPLESISALAAERVSGKLSGDVDVAFGPEVAPLLDARLEASGVAVGRTHDNRVTVNVNADRDTLRAAARVTQTDGFAEVKGTMPIAFPFAPSDAARPPSSRAGKVALRARHFRLAVLRPLAEGAVSRLDGRLDGDVTAVVSDGGSQTTMTGGIKVSDGAFEIPSLGEEFDAISADVMFDRSGKVSVNEFHAEGTTGKVWGSATAHLSGYTVDRATAHAVVPKSDPLPLAVGGQVIADAWGDVNATMTRKDGSAPDIRVQVSDAGVRLPNQSAHALQPLEPAERVRIGVMRSPGRLEVLSHGPLVVPGATAEGPTLRIVAKDVEVRRGTDLRFRLDGEPVIKTGRDEGVYGTINLRDGFLYVQGKKFEIEKGVISFHGTADDPEVVVTAGWTAPEGSRVYADFVGPLKTGKLTLRSDPPHTQSEILSLVLFGTTTGNAAPAQGGGAGSASAAASIGGGVAAQGLNRALDDLTGLDVTARVDTSESANPRPELEVRVARDVTVALAHVLGVPPPGTNPDRNFATVDFRLRRNWSLEATFGDQGSSLMDLVWQFRY